MKKIIWKANVKCQNEQTTSATKYVVVFFVKDFHIIENVAYVVVMSKFNGHKKEIKNRNRNPFSDSKRKLRLNIEYVSSTISMIDVSEINKKSSWNIGGHTQGYIYNVYHY